MITAKEAQNILEHKQTTAWQQTIKNQTETLDEDIRKAVARGKDHILIAPMFGLREEVKEALVAAGYTVFAATPGEIVKVSWAKIEKG